MQLIDLLKSIPAKPTDKGWIIMFDDILQRCNIPVDTLRIKLWELQRAGKIQIQNLIDNTDESDIIVGVRIVE